MMSDANIENLLLLLHNYFYKWRYDRSLSLLIIYNFDAYNYNKAIIIHKVILKNNAPKLH